VSLEADGWAFICLSSFISNIRAVEVDRKGTSNWKSDQGADI